MVAEVNTGTTMSGMFACSTILSEVVAVEVAFSVFWTTDRKSKSALAVVEAVTVVLVDVEDVLTTTSVAEAGSGSGSACSTSSSLFWLLVGKALVSPVVSGLGILSGSSRGILSIGTISPVTKSNPFITVSPFWY